MKFKKSIFILILAVFLISIAGVCASDVNDTAVASQDDAVIESTDENMITLEDSEPAVSMVENDEILSESADDEIVGVENDLDVLSADSAKYSDLANEVGSGGNIKLKHKYYTYDSGYIMITQSNSVIDGNGAIIDMTGTNIFAFYIDYRALGTTIKNLTIKNSGASEGSGVYAWSPCTIENCSFINNQAWDNGGAVFFRLSGKVINCYFESNRVTGSNGTGGAVYIEGNGEVINCSFNGNRADASGAVYIEGNGSVINCNFKDNSASDGGAVCISSIGTVKNCNFTNNTVNSTGAAVFILTKGTVENSNFVNNTAGEYGGAVQMMAGTVKNCNFTNNTAGDYGGAVYIYPLDGTVENCNFNYNSASDGGAVRLGSATVKNCNFTNNSAENYGGAITLRNEGNVTNCNFVNNTCENYGGALQIGSGTVTNCNFTNNSASSSDGGAVFIYDGGVVTNCNFVNNTAGEYGGALTFYENGNVTNCNFVNNTGGEYGGALAFYENGNVTNSNFTNNQALNGGAILIYGEGIVENCIFVNNHADNRAGGIIIYEGVVTNCNFTNNTGLYGAAIYAFDGFNVENCNFVNNIVGKAGGAVLIYDIGTVENCNFTNNSAEAGGAVMCYSNSEIKNCNFINNSGDRGCAVYLLEGGKITNSNFTNNSAESNGGAVFIKEDGIVENCNFNGNKASIGGGAVRIVENSTVTNCNFSDNYASEGGAVFIYDDGVVADCSFINNSATLSGGAIGLYNITDGVVSGCIFVNNSANNGTIYYNNTEYGSNLTINDNIFLNNDGVAIYFVKSDSTSNVDYNWFGNNATNYDMAPETNNVDINTWLFLNATANPDEICIFDSSDIVFKLYAYNSNGVSEYDNSRLNDVNLTLTPTNGNVNITEVGLDEPVRFNPEDYGICKLTAKIENVKYTTTLEIADGTTFSDLNFVINGNDNDTIVLDRDYTYNSTFDYNLNGGIVINRPLIIVGNGHTLNAAGLARIFSIQANNVVIENVTFVNGKSDRHGGAIFWSGNKGNISDCIFVNNSADQQGAAINLDGDDNIVSGCTFVNNSADQQGAIYWSGDNGNVSGCSFVNNSASDGGALTFMGYKGSVSGCSFVNNSARLDGGAIYLDESDEGIVSNCSFENNYANRQGGAISWRYTKDGIVSDCSFVNNSALDGGAIYLENYDNGNVSGSIFVNNRANYGIVYFDNSLYGHLSVNDNIFLNNDGVAIYFVDSDSTSDANYNWFGNNATNYDVAPTTTNVELGTWLFLNATAYPASISVSESSDILFKLYSYGAGGVSDYDDSKLPVFNLTVTANNGDVDESIIALGDSVEFTPNGAGDASVTAAVENAEYTVVLDVAKAVSVLSGDDLVMAYRDGSAWAVALNDEDGNGIAGKVVKIGININGLDKVYSFVTDVNGVAGLPINLISGTYAVNATFEGDDDYEASFTNATVTVNRAVAVLTGGNLEMTYKDGSSWVVALSDADGDAIVGVKVAIGVAGKVYNIKTDDEGNAVLPINLPSGTYTVNASFTDSRYETDLITAEIIVNKAVPVLSAEDLIMNYKDGSAWSVTLTDANGNVMADTYVKLTVAGKTYSRKTNSDGVVSLPINLAVGNYTVSASFDGSSNLGAVEINRTIVVNPPVYDLVANNINMTYQDGTSYNVQIADAQGSPVAQAGVVIKVTINGKSYDRKTNADGIASLPINLRAGSYEITAEYNGKQITNTIVVNNA